MSRGIKLKFIRWSNSEITFIAFFLLSFQTPTNLFRAQYIKANRTAVAHY